jgi:hypothetical protein
MSISVQGASEKAKSQVGMGEWWSLGGAQVTFTGDEKTVISCFGLLTSRSSRYMLVRSCTLSTPNLRRMASSGWEGHTPETSGFQDRTGPGGFQVIILVGTRRLTSVLSVRSEVTISLPRAGMFGCVKPERLRVPSWDRCELPPTQCISRTVGTPVAGSPGDGRVPVNKVRLVLCDSA